MCFTGFEARGKGELFSHFDSECGKKTVNRCIICNESFKTQSRFSIHTRAHPKTDLTCSGCDKSFANYRHFSVHMQGHEKKKCKICSKEFALASLLRKHMRSHAQGNSFQCLGCDERFDHRIWLVRHRRERPQTCKLAPYIENDTSEECVDAPNIEVKVEKDPNKYKCVKCDKGFRSEKKLAKHRHEDHKFKCDRCGTGK